MESFKSPLVITSLVIFTVEDWFLLLVLKCSVAHGDIILKAHNTFTMYSRLLILIEEGIHHLGMAAHQGRPSYQAADKVLEIPATQIVTAT